MNKVTIRKDNLGQPAIVHQKGGSVLMEVTGLGAKSAATSSPTIHVSGTPNKDEEAPGREWIPRGLTTIFLDQLFR